MERELTITDVADATGLSPHTLRYYERAGLLAPVSRNEGGHRRYRALDVDSLIFLTRLRSMGMPIQQVRDYSQLAREGEETIPARKRMLEQHRANVRARIAELEGNLAVLDQKIDLYERGLVGNRRDACLDRLARDDEANQTGEQK